jgi:hypothetical protein
MTSSYTQQPRLRTPEEVLERLFGWAPRPAETAGKEGPRRGRPEYKHVWARLMKGKTGVISDVTAEMQRQGPHQTKS